MISKGITYTLLKYGKKERKGEMFEIVIAENFLKLMADNKPQIQEVQTSFGINTKY